MAHKFLMEGDWIEMEGEGNREVQLHQSMVAVALTIGFFRSGSRRRKLKGGLNGFDLVFPRILPDARVCRHELLVQRHG
jgi:hypothetical protein